MLRYCYLSLLGLVLGPMIASADMIPMRDFIQLKTGMTEAEVLFRIGTYDYESVYTDYHHHLIKKIWYYIPVQKGSDAWISEIVIDHSGQIQSLQRYRARR
ncbi:MAG: hypothetical protein ACE5GZ_06375 [Gammaproteobacteria bacterium]